MLSVQEIKNQCYSTTYQKGAALFREDSVKAEIVPFEGEDGEALISVEGVVKGSGQKKYRVSVVLDHEDEIYDYTCECPAAVSYWGMCKHCVAMALHYRNAQKQESATRINKKAVRAQKTTENLKNIISGYAVRGKAFAVGGFYKQVELVPEFKEYYGRYSVEFKIGTNRKYILKNVCRFLYNVENGAWDEYGKNLQFTHDRSAFTDEALRWIDTMSDILRVQYSNMNFSTQLYSSNFREIGLQGYGIDRCLQLYLGESICINKTDYRVVDENPNMTILLEGERDGSGLSMHIEKMAAIYGSQNRYLIRDDVIYRCSEEFVRDIWPILIALEAVPEQGYSFARERGAYLSSEDYSAFCGNILPVLEKYTDVEIKNVDFEPYRPQEAEFNVYLDMDSNDDAAITVRAEAVYGSQKYDLFAEKNLEKEYRDLEREQVLDLKIRSYFDFDDNIFRPEQKKDGIAVITGYCRKEQDVYKLVQEGMGEIQQLANVFIDDRIRNIRMLKTPKVTMGVGIKNDLLQMNVQVEDMNMDEIMGILSAYKRRKKYYRLKNGDFVSLEDNGLSVISELASGLLLDEKELKEGRFTVPEYRAGYVSEVLKNGAEGVSVERSTDFKKLIRDMKSYADSDFEVPESLQADLRNYQKDGFRWLAMLDAWGFGGILADDMGLGKTLQVITLLEMKKKTALIVCPASLVYNWESEIRRFAPEAEPVVVAGNGEERKHLIENIAPAAGKTQIWVTSYDLLKRDISEYKNISFDTIIIDEAQYIKNAGTQASKAVKMLKGHRRFALTGTPIENRLSDLWSIFDFIMPGYLYGYTKFRDELEKPIVQSQDEVALKRLKMMVSPFILRRKKADVLKDLPDKLEEVVYTRMTGEQRRLYDAQTAKLKMELAGQTDEDYNNNKLKYLAELTKLRMICCAPSLCYENYRAESAKTDMCLELLDNAIAGGHRILLFSQFTQMLDILARALDDKKVKYLYLSGKNTKEQRKRMVDVFQRGNIPVFLISLKAGGTGLNLTAADVVIHYDPWWNVAAQNQATDRTHRIGQKNVVNVMSLVAKDTIEERIVQLQKKKAELAESVIEGKGMAEHRISREELLELLSSDR